MTTEEQLYQVSRNGMVLNKHFKWTPMLDFALRLPKAKAMSLARIYNAWAEPTGSSKP